jgi:hypothetical protein
MKDEVDLRGKSGSEKIVFCARDVPQGSCFGFGCNFNVPFFTFHPSSFTLHPFFLVMSVEIIASISNRLKNVYVTVMRGQ